MIFGSDAPSWARLAELRIVALFNDIREPKAPVRKFSVKTAAGLPDAKKYVHCEVLIIDTRTVVMSDGITWEPAYAF